MDTGVIVAGGRSTRFGDDDKAVAPLAGTPMIRRVADRLSGVVDELVINCREDQIEAVEAALSDVGRPVVLAPDPEPDQGPMAGIRTGLAAATGDYAVVVACDMPYVEPALVEYLFERAAGHDAAVPRLGDGWFQTTQAVYRAAAMVAACEDALAHGDRRIVAAFDDLDLVTVGEDEVLGVADLRTFENLNTREEFEAAAARFSREE